MRHAKKERMAHTQEKKQSVEAVPEDAQMLDLIDRTLNQLFRNISKELKESMRTVPYQIERINELQILPKKNQKKKILEMKSTLTEMKSQRGSASELNRQKKDSANSMIGQLRLSSLRKRKKEKKKD